VDLIEIMNDDSHSHIRGRFFTLSTNFYGLKSEKDVKDCLKQYDTLRFPLEAGPTYTEYFLYNDFIKGWRLASISRLMWKVFREYKRKYKLTTWGMQYFIVATNILLTDFLPHYGVDSVSEQMVNVAIELSGLVADQVRPAG